jgi:hypothetical protein
MLKLLKSIIRALSWKPWVRTVNGVQISFATPRSYFVQIGDKHTEVCFDVGGRMETVIYGSSLKTWMEPKEDVISEADKERVLGSVTKFMTAAGYKPRIE